MIGNTDNSGDDLGRKGGKPTLGGVLAAAAFSAAGVAFYVYSGRAEGFISPRLGFILVVLTSVPLLVYLGMATAFRLRRPGPGNRRLIIAGAMVGYLFIALGYRLDGQLTARSMDRGDRLALAIEDHRRATGAYPESLGQLGGPPPAPALADSAFTYRRTDNGYRIAFPSVAFLTCWRTAANFEWRCDD